MKNFYEKPMQVAFIEKGDDADNSVNYGIAFQDTVICACCGGVFELAEVVIVKEFDWWVSFKDEIKGDDEE